MPRRWALADVGAAAHAVIASGAAGDRRGQGCVASAVVGQALQRDLSVTQHDRRYDELCRGLAASAGDHEGLVRLSDDGTGRVAQPGTADREIAGRFPTAGGGSSWVRRASPAHRDAITAAIAGTIQFSAMFAFGVLVGGPCAAGWATSSTSSARVCSRSSRSGVTPSPNCDACSGCCASSRAPGWSHSRAWCGWTSWLVRSAPRRRRRRSRGGRSGTVYVYEPGFIRPGHEDGPKPRARAVGLPRPSRRAAGSAAADLYASERLSRTNCSGPR